MTTRLMTSASIAMLALGTQQASAQTLQSIQKAEAPLVLSARGSFFVGGNVEDQTAADLGTSVDDVVTVNQMYVEYMVPDGDTGIPFVMIHGAGLSGKTYDTTPDGRMGWFEYFVRQGHPTYVVDQVGRARSGFDQAAVNRRLSGTADGGDGQGVFRFGSRFGVWTNFRFGPSYGEAFDDSQFPTEAIDELAKQGVPDMRAFLPSPNPTFSALAELARDVGNVVLISHSQSGHFPMEAALLDPSRIAGIVALEPGTCGNDLFSDEDIQALARVPALIIFGDHLAVDTQFSDITWQDRFDDCETYVERITDAGGDVTLIDTRSLGFSGNSHMLMQDKNSIAIADVVMQWAGDHAKSGN